MNKETLVFAPATFNLAETTRMLEIAKLLRPKFNCLFFGFSDRYAEMIIENEFSFQLLEPVFSSEQVQQIMRLDQMRGIKNPFTEKLVNQRVANELAFLTKHQPKIILTGTNMTIFLSARIARIPLVYVKPYALSRPFYLEKRQIKKTFSDWLIMNLRWHPKAFKQVAKKYGLKLPKYSIDLLDGDYNYITTAPMFYDSRFLPDNYYPVGPIFAKISHEIPQTVKDFIQYARQQKKRLVYFAVGSSGNRSFVLNGLKRLVANDFYVLAPVKNYLTAGDLKGFGENILCTDWLPAHLCSSLVDFSVIHGGEGTVQTACQSGKPFIGFGFQMEQKINLLYCEKYGNALHLKARQLNSDIFSAALQQIQEPIYLAKAQQLQKKFRVDGAEKVTELIKGLINARNVVETPAIESDSQKNSGAVDF